MTIEQRDQELKRLLQRKQPPEPELTAVVMQQISHQQIEKGRFYMKHKVKLLVMAGMLLAVSSAFGSTTFLYLKDRTGDVVHEEGTFKQHSMTEDELADIPRRSRMNQIWDTMGDGEAAFIYVVPDNPHHLFELKLTPHTFTDEKELFAKLDRPQLELPGELAIGYTFKSGTIIFEPSRREGNLSEKERQEVVQELQEIARQSGQDYAVLPVAFNKEFWAFTMDYVKGEEEVSLRVTNLFQHGSKGYAEEHIQMEKTMLEENGKEAIMTRDEGGQSVELTWIVENQEESRHHYLYSLRAHGNSAEEKLKQIWRQIVQ